MSSDILSINATYENNTQLFECKRKDFLSEVSKRFGINENEVMIFQSSKNCRREISVECLKSVSKIEIMKKTSPTVIHMNGQRASSSNQYIEAEERIIEKLTRNQVLSGDERKYLISMIHQCAQDRTLKQKFGNEDQAKSMTNVKKYNKKVQVKMMTKDSVTQTDVEAAIELGIGNQAKRKKRDEVELQIRRGAAKNDLTPEERKQLLKDSYSDRRQFILLNLPLVQRVKEKYPLLFSYDEVKRELERIFYEGICNDFLKNIEKYSAAILDIAKPEDPILAKTKNTMEKCQTEVQKCYAQEVGSILLLSNLVNEERKYLRLLDKDTDPGDFPHIDAHTSKMRELYYDTVMFKVVVEGIVLCEAFTFKEAILCLVAAFYIFNITYPDANFNTYVVFEKLYLGGTETVDIPDDVQQIIKYLKFKAVH